MSKRGPWVTPRSFRALAVRLGLGVKTLKVARMEPINFAGLPFTPTEIKFMAAHEAFCAELGRIDMREALRRSCIAGNEL